MASMTITDIFNALAAGLKADPTVVKRVNATFQFDIDLGGAKKSWVVDLKNGEGGIKEGSGTADCTIGVSQADFVDLMTGKSNGQQLFMNGKLKIKGNMMLAMKLQELTAQIKKGSQEAGLTSGGAAPAAAAPAGAAPASGGSLANIFAQIEQNAKADPKVVANVNGSYKFVVATAKGEQTWLVSLKKGSQPSVSQANGDADCTITIKEEDFLAMAAGKLDGQSAFLQGKLKIKGNMGLAMKLGDLIGKNKAKL